MAFSKPSVAQAHDGFMQFDREVCPRCTFKHLAYAYVALEEVAHGYKEHLKLAEHHLNKAGFAIGPRKESIRHLLDAKARSVGHLVHAMEECPDRRIAKKIRTAYTAILDGEPAQDILSIIEELEKSNENP